MLVERKVSLLIDKGNEFKVGDVISVGKYTATCQKLSKTKAIFCFDQYLDEIRPMIENEDKDGYKMFSDLLSWLNGDKALKIFEDIRDQMVNIDRVNLVRIPYYEEIFGKQGDDPLFEDFNLSQWSLMKQRKNRMVFIGKNEKLEWGWLMNRSVVSATAFAVVSGYGDALNYLASVSIGVRPVFALRR